MIRPPDTAIPPRLVRSRAVRTAGLLCILLAGIWVTGDWVYSRVVARRLNQWEAGITRNPEGVRAGCEAFTTGSGPVALLMIHGFADTPAVFARMADDLAARGFTCRAMRLPGSGEPTDRMNNIAPDLYRQAIRGEVEALRQDHRQVWVVAHSMGGALAIRNAMENPESIDGLILLAPLIAVSRARSPLLSPGAWYGVARHTLIFTGMLESFFPRDLYDPQAGEPDLRDRFFPMAVYDTLYASLRAIKGQAGRIRVPSLFVVAGRDRVVKTDAAERYFADCRGIRKQLVWLPRSGHVIPLDVEAAVAEEAIVAFIRQGDEQP